MRKQPKLEFTSVDHRISIAYFNNAGITLIVLQREKYEAVKVFFQQASALAVNH